MSMRVQLFVPHDPDYAIDTMQLFQGYLVTRTRGKAMQVWHLPMLRLAPRRQADWQPLRWALPALSPC